MDRARTEATYVHWIRRFIVFHHKKHPSTMGVREIAAFLSWLATDQRVSASTQNQALSALLFLYRHVLGIDVGAIEQVPRAKMPHRVPVVLSRDEVGAILKHIDGAMRIVVVELRVKDIDFDRHEIIVRRGKGQKDRRTMLPVAIEERLKGHLREVKRQHERDLAGGFGRVVLPFALDRKYPKTPTDWAWQFVFPASRICRDPQWGPPTRFHVHESAVQREVAHAVRRSGIAKRVGLHSFRHSFATHLLEDGCVLISKDFGARLLGPWTAMAASGGLAVHSVRR
ncbi:MAG: integron integrase [Acidobacteria bacterium]|nr:integron integrase [Acidobacteriota bacterium]